MARAIDINVHLPKDAPVAEAWRNQIRLMALQRMQSIPRDDFFSYSVVFSGDHLMDGEIREKFLAFLKSVQDSSLDRNVEKIYQMNFDLLPWTR